jgi:hypothetical protein
MTEKIYVQVGEEKREATQYEIAQLQKDKMQYEAIQAEQDAKVAARASALAKLAALGLTEEEIGAL